MVNTNNSINPKLIKTIVWAWLLVGTLDILAASTQTLLNGRDPMNMYRFIASGVFGSSAMSGGVGYSLLGLLFHYCIAMGWTVIFFLVYRKISVLARNRIVTGFLYGIFVQLCMSFIVLPLANTPTIPFNLVGMIKAAWILVVAIGIPLAFIAHRYFHEVK